MKSNVLLIADDPLFKAVFTLGAAELDCQIVQCNQLKEASSVLATQKSDLIVIDKQLPDGDGLEWVRKIRSNAVYTPVILTAASLNDDAELKLLLQTEDCLVVQKPVSVLLLSKILMYLLSRKLTDEDSAGTQFAIGKSEFVKVLPDLLRRLGEILVKAEGPPVKREEVGAAARLAHMILGYSITFGFLNIAKEIHWLEERLRAILAPGKGNSFFHPWLTYRRTIADILMSLHTKQPAKSTINASGCLNLPRVTCFTGDRSFASRLRSLLGSEGFLVYTFDKATEASIKFLSTFPDLILAVPEELDFFELAALQELSFLWRVPLVLTSPRTQFAEMQASVIQPYKLYFLERQMTNFELLSKIKAMIEERVPYRMDPCGERDKAFAGAVRNAEVESGKYVSAA